MKKSIIMLLILISIFSTKASAISFLNANANFCHKDDIDCKNSLQTAANGVDKAGEASITAVNSVEPSITPITNSIGGFLHLFGF